MNFCELHYSINDMIKEEYDTAIDDLEDSVYIEESLKNEISIAFLDSSIKKYEKNLEKAKQNYEWWQSLTPKQKEQERVKAKVLAQNAATVGSILEISINVTGAIVSMVTGSKIATILASLGAFGVKVIAKEVGKNKQDIDAFSEIKQGVQYRVTIDNLTKDLNILKEKRKELEKEQENKKNSIIKKKAMQESCDESLLNLYLDDAILL